MWVARQRGSAPGIEDELIERLSAVPVYQALFPAAFPGEDDPFTLDSVTKAIAAFERTLLSGDSPFDRYWYQDDRSAMSASALRGFDLFLSERTECFHCHGGFNFSDAAGTTGQALEGPTFHNTALYNLDGEGAYPEPNRGIYEITGVGSDMGRFRAPTLRNIALTAPYMHDGSIETLDAVIDHYASGGRSADNPHKSGFMVGFVLTEQERADLHAFFESLTDETFITNEAFSDPW